MGVQVSTLNRSERMTIMKKKKKSQGSAFIILGILSVIYFILTLIILGGITFAEFYLVLGIILILLGYGKKYTKRGYLILVRGMVKNVIMGIIALGLVSFVALETVIISSAIPTKKTDSDYLVVLGAGLRGEIPSLTLLQRLNRSLEYIKNNPDIKVVVSGGQGSGETITEAEAMKRYLTRHGVNEESIIKEDKSTNTSENLKFTAKILKEVDKRENLKITIVTSDFHVFRGKFLAERYGFKADGYGVISKLILMPTYYVREYFAVVKSFVFDK